MTVLRCAFLSLLCLGPLPAQQRPAREALQKLLQQYDKDHDGRIQKAEYPRGDAAFRNLDRDGNGVIDATDFDPARAPPARPPARPPAPRVSPPAAGNRAAKLPQPGDLAPDFELPMLGMKGTTVKLSSFRGDRPVALIFGSYT